MAPPRRPYNHLWETLRQTTVLRFPRHRLATFGRTEIQYQLISSVSARPALANLRTGKVIAERPQILTPDMFSQRFQGFGDDASSFERFFKDNFSDSFRGLEYSFRNELAATEPHRTDARELAKTIRRDLDARDVARAAVIVGPESGWSFSLMKFILEETSQSFSVNMRELDERGLFNPESSEERRRQEVEVFFRRAEADPALIKPLADLLNRTQLFDEFQDRFFGLVNRTPR
ncbi:MAG: hypothetical protein JNK54_02720 [Elusimicrobia bacterium]|jgi:hypothetical protein|nr:hypothetical protein [Elusimicrobiota bacterium]